MRLDGEEACFGFGAAGVVTDAGWAAENAKRRGGFGAVGAVAAGVGGAVDADDGLAERAGEVERAGIAGDEEPDAAGKGDELGKGADDGAGAISGSGNDCGGEGLFAGTGVDENGDAGVGEGRGDRSVALGGPAFCAPAGAGVDEGERFAGANLRQLGAPFFGGWVDGQQGRGGGEEVAGDGAGELHVLLDDVGAGGWDAFGVEQARGPFAGLFFADDAAAAGQAGDDGGANCALEIEDGVVLGVAQIAAEGEDFVEGCGVERFAAPGLGGYPMDLINEGLRREGLRREGLRREGLRREGLRRASVSCVGREQGLPSGLDGPADSPGGVHLAQGGDRREGMENIAHGPETDHQQPKLNTIPQSSIFSQWRFGGGESMGWSCRAGL